MNVFWVWHRNQDIRIHVQSFIHFQAQITMILKWPPLVTVFRRINVLGMEAEIEPVPLPDLDEIHRGHS